MKTLSFAFLLIPTLIFGQVSSWRQSGGSMPSQTTQSAPRVQPSVPQQQNNVSQWRTQTAPIRPGDRYDAQPLVRRYKSTPINPYGLYYGTWGWYQPYPYIWYDTYGWRQRSEIRIYENGKRDTISKNTYFTAGLGHTNNSQASFWGAIGDNKDILF